MTDLARGLWCGDFGDKGEADAPAARASSASNCDIASEPRPPAEMRRNDRRLMEKPESVHIKKPVACQKHLAKVRPYAEVHVALRVVDGLLFTHESFGASQFIGGRRPNEGHLESEIERAVEFSGLGVGGA